MTSPNETNVAPGDLLRRTAAADYVQRVYGFPCSPKTLAKLACLSSNGPRFRMVGRIIRRLSSMHGLKPRLVPWCDRRPKSPPNKCPSATLKKMAPSLSSRAKAGLMMCQIHRLPPRGRMRVHCLVEEIALRQEEAGRCAQRTGPNSRTWGEDAA